MPIEIRELVIRAVVAQAEEADEMPETSASSVDKESIVQECIRQVMNILKKKEER